MKKLSFLAAILFVTVTSFGQTTIENKNAIKNKTNAQAEQKEIRVSNEGSVESGTTIHSNAVQNIESATQSTVHKQKQSASKAKEKAVSKTKSTSEVVKQTASEDISVSGSAQTDANVNVSLKDNNASASQNASSGLMLSTKVLQNDISEKQQNGAINEKGKKATAQVENTAIKQKEKLKSGTANTINAGASSVNTIKPHPVTIKTNTLLKTSGGLHLR